MRPTVRCWLRAAPRARASRHWPKSSRANTRQLQHSASKNQSHRSSSSELKSATSGSNLIFGTTVGLLLAASYLYITDTRSGIHRYIAVPTLRLLFPDAEDAHHAGIQLLKYLHILGLNPRETASKIPRLPTVEVFGHKLGNPLAISGGLDKNAEIVTPLFDLGPAIVEVGGITPLPQDGNLRPRVWRVPSQNAMINRYGLNSWGAAAVARQLQTRVREFARAHGIGIDADAEARVLNGELGVPPGSLVEGRLLAVQIAKNKATDERDTDAVTRDYVTCVQHLGRFADIIVVNVSSPNTPGLRDLQKTEPLKKVLGGVVKACRAVERKSKPAVMVKVSPDEKSDADLLGICEAVWQTGVDGVIVGNTTRSRPLLEPKALQGNEQGALAEQGGYSGPGMFEDTVKLVKRYRAMLDVPLEADASTKSQRKVIFASGGITQGTDVLRVMEAGASVAMVYTGMTYGGTGFISHLKEQMSATSS